MTRFFASALLAFGLQALVDVTLPADTPRMWVIIAGWLACLAWSPVDDFIRKL